MYFAGVWISNPSKTLIFWGFIYLALICLINQFIIFYLCIIVLLFFLSGMKARPMLDWKGLDLGGIWSSNVVTDAVTCINILINKLRATWSILAWLIKKEHHLCHQTTFVDMPDLHCVTVTNHPLQPFRQLWGMQKLQNKGWHTVYFV